MLLFNNIKKTRKKPRDVHETLFEEGKHSKRKKYMVSSGITKKK